MTSIKDRYKGVLRLVEMRYGNGTVKWRIEKRNPGLGYNWMLTDCLEYPSKNDAMIAADELYKTIVVEEIPHEE